MRELLEKELANKPFFLTTKDVEELINSSHTCVSELIKAGELPAFKFGRNYKIPKESLIDWILKSKI